MKCSISLQTCSIEDRAEAVGSTTPRLWSKSHANEVPVTMEYGMISHNHESDGKFSGCFADVKRNYDKYGL